MEATAIPSSDIINDQLDRWSPGPQKREGTFRRRPSTTSPPPPPPPSERSISASSPEGQGDVSPPSIEPPRCPRVCDGRRGDGYVDERSPPSNTKSTARSSQTLQSAKWTRRRRFFNMPVISSLTANFWEKLNFKAELEKPVGPGGSFDWTLTSESLVALTWIYEKKTGLRPT